MREAIRRRLLVAGVVFACLFMIVPQLGPLLTFPDQLRVLPGQDLKLDVGPFFTLSALPAAESPEAGDAANAGGPGARTGEGIAKAKDAPQTPASGETDTGPESFEVELRLFGWIPLRRAEVDVVSEVSVIPGGQAIGILLSSQGLVVVETAPVITESGQEVSPAADAGVMPGDIIVQVGETVVDHPIEIESLSESYGAASKPMPLVVRRNGRRIRLWVTPVLGRDPRGEGYRYMLGLYLKDPAAGVGTLTFWEPRRGMYGALGHMITDRGEPVRLSDGRIVAAQIHGIHPGARGRPGEKVGIFQSEAPLGTIEKNSQFGIFGRLVGRPPLERRPVPVALSHEVREGPAQILTVIDGGRVDAFDVEILAIHRQARPTGKGIVLQVTDPELLRRTRGIVQGMSGSPILQDGKLVGAVTHVFINDPTRGFGVLAEWMVYEAGILDGSRTPALSERRAG